MKEFVAIISVFVNLILAVGKILIGLLIKSSAILAEGIHSSMDVFSSFISLFGIKASNRPVDKKHPYGYYKFEVISGLLITLLLFFAGLWTIYEAVKSFLSPEIIVFSYFGLGIMVASIIFNEVMARVKIYYGKKEKSISLLSDGVHDRIDVYTSIAVLIGLIVMPYWIYIDSILALFIGIYILKESFSLGKEATDSLLDVSAGSEVEDIIKLIGKQEKIEIYEIKTQKKGSVVTANIGIKLSNKLSVEEATNISENLRKKLNERIDNLSYVAIQIKSHDVENNYFKPNSFIGLKTGNDFQWHFRGKFNNSHPSANGVGPNGFCVCPKCGYEEKHSRGKPCFQKKCLKCGTKMVRK